MSTRSAAALAGVACLVIFFAAQGAAATSYKVIHSFCSPADCSDGATPMGKLLVDGDGDLYGTTTAGSGSGTLFQLSPNAKKTKWKLTTIYTFCSKPACADGETPIGEIVRDAAGNFYGTTEVGGKFNHGIAYKISPLRKKWRLTVLYDFCHQGRPNTCNDGREPLGLTYVGARSGAPYDGVSPLYGATQSGGGGAFGGFGTVFEITNDAGSWSHKAIYKFCPGGSPCNDGDQPTSSLMADDAGNLYGASAIGGAFNDGTIFKLAPNAKQTRWTESVAHSFCADTNCHDGANPKAAVVMDASGDLYGTAQNTDWAGLAFKLTPNGSGWDYNILYSFCALDGCPDGSTPRTALLLAPDNVIYGTTSCGGVSNDCGGILFKLSDGLTALHDFCSDPNCTDGSFPNWYDDLTMDSSGTIYGTTSQGGDNNLGTVYEYVP